MLARAIISGIGSEVVRIPATRQEVLEKQERKNKEKPI